MKTILIPVVLVGMALASAEAVGAEAGQAAKSTAKAKSEKSVSRNATKVVYVSVTGSRIPRAIPASSVASGTELTLTVIDSKQLDRLGAGTLTEALRKTPMFR